MAANYQLIRGKPQPYTLFQKWIASAEASESEREAFAKRYRQVLAELENKLYGTVVVYTHSAIQLVYSKRTKAAMFDMSRKKLSISPQATSDAVINALLHQDIEHLDKMVYVVFHELAHLKYDPTKYYNGGFDEMYGRKFTNDETSKLNCIFDPWIERRFLEEHPNAASVIRTGIALTYGNYAKRDVNAQTYVHMGHRLNVPPVLHDVCRKPFVKQVGDKKASEWDDMCVRFHALREVFPGDADRAECVEVTREMLQFIKENLPDLQGDCSHVDNQIKENAAADGQSGSRGASSVADSEEEVPDEDGVQGDTGPEKPDEDGNRESEDGAPSDDVAEEGSDDQESSDNDEDSVASGEDSESESEESSSGASGGSDLDEDESEEDSESSTGESDSAEDDESEEDSESSTGESDSAEDGEPEETSESSTGESDSAEDGEPEETSESSAGGSDSAEQDEDQSEQDNEPSDGGSESSEQDDTEEEQDSETSSENDSSDSQDENQPEQSNESNSSDQNETSLAESQEESESDSAEETECDGASSEQQNTAISEASLSEEADGEQDGEASLEASYDMLDMEQKLELLEQQIEQQSGEIEQDDQEDPLNPELVPLDEIEYLDPDEPLPEHFPVIGKGIGNTPTELPTEIDETLEEALLKLRERAESESFFVDLDLRIIVHDVNIVPPSSDRKIHMIVQTYQSEEKVGYVDYTPPPNLAWDSEFNRAYNKIKMLLADTRDDQKAMMVGDLDLDCVIDSATQGYSKPNVFSRTEVVKSSHGDLFIVIGYDCSGSMESAFGNDHHNAAVRLKRLFDKLKMKCVLIPWSSSGGVLYTDRETADRDKIRIPGNSGGGTIPETGSRLAYEILKREDWNRTKLWFNLTDCGWGGADTYSTAIANELKVMTALSFVDEDITEENMRDRLDSNAAMFEGYTTRKFANSPGQVASHIVDFVTDLVRGTSMTAQKQKRVPRRLPIKQDGGRR